MATVDVAAVFVALYAGHQIGDHVVQASAAARSKGAPSPGMLANGAHPWRGWRACLRHVGSYSLTQAAALLLVTVATPIGASSMFAALAVSASTHAVIDRRWLVRLLIAAKRCQEWREAPYLIDQSLHVAALLVAAVFAGKATSAAGAGAVSAGAVALVGAAMFTERRLAAAYARTGTPSAQPSAPPARSG